MRVCSRAQWLTARRWGEENKAMVCFFLLLVYLLFSLSNCMLTKYMCFLLIALGWLLNQHKQFKHINISISALSKRIDSNLSSYFVGTYSIYSKIGLCSWVFFSPKLLYHHESFSHTVSQSVWLASKRQVVRRWPEWERS